MSLLSKKIKERGQKISFVPTMGALHEGHLSLITSARKKGDLVVVSIFVNPIQFGPAEDFSRYPRDLTHDKKLLKPHDPIIIFNPKSEEMYGPDFKSYVEVADLSEKLCGPLRPGHFRGVATVVAKLFNIVKPDYAFFGEKDFQQLVIIRKMAKDLNCDVQIVAVPTARESDGLAKSSRNSYLSCEERKSAAALYRSLCLAKKMIRAGGKSPQKIIRAMNHIISREPVIKIEYISIVNPETLEDAKKIKGKVLVALAARIKKTRLIDNMLINSR